MIYPDCGRRHSRRKPTTRQAEAQIQQWQDQAQSALQGKQLHRKSGRYPANEIPHVEPHMRWPNQGLIVGNSHRRWAYDDLSLPQWICGQITNIRQIQDLGLLHAMLDQVIYAMKDACRLPWHQVREAYACSMHEIEEGRLTWTDSIKWYFNRLEAERSTTILLSHKRSDLLNP